MDEEIKKKKKKKNKKKPEKLLQKGQIVVVVCHDDPGNPKPKSEKRKRTEGDYYSVSNSNSMERANAVASSLPPEFPNFIKSMLPSHVTGGFWLGLPKQFCIRHLPKQDTAVTLEDESGRCYETKYLWQKVGLSAGWRGFSIAHDLVEGDAVVFQLVTLTKFKVYIVRSNRFDEVDGALGLLELDPISKKSPSSNSNSNTTSTLVEDDKYWEPFAIDDNQPKIGPEHSSDELICEVLDGIRFSQSAIGFKDVRGIEDFTVVIDGLVIDSEISKHVMIKYYELCRSQKRYLHDCLVEGINCKLTAGVVSETVNIADAIRASKINTSAENFSIWERTLRAFADLGMEVGFLLARLEKLVKIDVEPRRVTEARNKRVEAEQEIVALEDKITSVKETMKRLDAEIESMEKKENRVELMFQETAKARW